MKEYPILTYHSINYAKSDSTHKSVMVTPEKFSRHMFVLHALGYRCVALSELSPYVRGEKVGKVIGLTFDDGYEDNIRYALPVLKKYRFTATCFFVSKRIGQYNQWDKEKGVQRLALMTGDEVRLWHDAGMEVGGHTQYHVDVSDLDETSLIQEIIQGKQDIEQIIGSSIAAFAYPYGCYSERALAMVRRAGYELAVTTERSLTACGTDLLAMPRVTVPRSVLLPIFLLKNFTQYEKRRFKSLKAL